MPWNQSLKEFVQKNKVGLTQFLKFVVTGTVGAGIDFAIYGALTRLAHFYFLYANLCSVFLAILATFILNKYWTFESREPGAWKSQSWKFFVVAGTNYVLQQLILTLIVFYTPLERITGKSLKDIGAKVIAVGIVMFSNFFLNKYWTFRNHSAKVAASVDNQ